MCNTLNGNLTENEGKRNQFTDISNGIEIEEDEFQHHPNGTELKKWKCGC